MGVKSVLQMIFYCQLLNIYYLADTMLSTFLSLFPVTVTDYQRLGDYKIKKIILAPSYVPEKVPAIAHLLVRALNSFHTQK